MPLAGTRWGPLLCTAVFASCHSFLPDERAFAYNLELGSLTRDFPAQRYYACRVTFELDVHVPLPDSFTTVADAVVRRSVVLNSGPVLTADTIVRDVTVRVERLARAESSATSPDSIQVVLAGAIADTIHGAGFGGDQGYYVGSWICGPGAPAARVRGATGAGIPGRCARGGRLAPVRQYSPGLRGRQGAGAPARRRGR